MANYEKFQIVKVHYDGQVYEGPILEVKDRGLVVQIFVKCEAPIFEKAVSANIKFEDVVK